MWQHRVRELFALSLCGVTGRTLGFDTMKHIVILSAALPACLTIWQPEAHAYPEPQPLPLSQAVAQSRIVVVAEVEAYQGDEEPSAPKAQANTPTVTISTGLDGMLQMSKAQNAGLYRLRALKYLRGAGDAALSIRLPPFYWFAYDSRIHIAPGDHVLLLAVPDAKNEWAPIDPWRPLIPLSKEPVAAPPDAEPATPLGRVYSLLLGSMAEPTLRGIHSYLLRDAADPQLVPALARYINDPDERVQENVIENMAVNQQVAVIPRIVAMSEAAWRESKGQDSGGPVTRLGKFTVPQATPYLNAALFSPEQFTRINTLFSVGHIADRSSVPYLLLTLFDPEPQKMNAQSAYYILHRVLPDLGKPPKPEDFWKNREAETTRLLDWWRDELAGKHPKAENEPPTPVIDFEKIKPEEAARILNPLLFEKKPELRQQAAQALQKSAQASSIPYLLLALHDPDPTVSFLAYRALHRLIETLPPPTGREPFEARREAYTKELFDWWCAELLGQHFAPDPRPAAPAPPPAPAFAR